MPYRSIMQDGAAREICVNILSRMEDAVPALKLAKEQWASKILLQQVLRNSISWSKRKLRESSKSSDDAASTVTGALGLGGRRCRTQGGSAINMDLTPLKRKPSAHVEKEDELEDEADVRKMPERVGEENEKEKERILKFFARN